MKYYVMILVAAAALSACGGLDRSMAHLTGKGSETCQGHVIYLQFTSGVSVKYLPDGHIATC